MMQLVYGNEGQDMSKKNFTDFPVYIGFIEFHFFFLVCLVKAVSVHNLHMYYSCLVNASIIS